MPIRDHRVNVMVSKEKRWPDEMKLLHQIMQETILDEVIKWRQPCYALNDKNVVILSSFKNYCCLGFFKGSLMDDPYDKLVQPTENMQAIRHLQFTSYEEIEANIEMIREYIDIAIAVEKSGLKLEKADVKSVDVPIQLLEIFEQDPEFEAAFNKLTPGRQRAYLLHFSGAKQDKTKVAQIEKYRAKIMANKGILE